MTKYLTTVLLGVLLVLLFTGGMIAAQDADTCQQIVDNGLDSVATNCANMVPNSACYGSPLVEALFFDSFAVPEGVFSEAGQHVDLRMVEQLMTAKNEEPTVSWGISVMQTQADIPFEEGAFTMLLFGDAIITNTVLPADAVDIVTEKGQQTPMQSFDLVLGEENPDCIQAFSGLLLQTPEGYPVTLQINGAPIEISGDETSTANVLIQLAPDGIPQLQVISGTVTLFAGTTFEITVPTGFQVPLALDDEGQIITPTNVDELAALQASFRIMSDETLEQLAVLENLPSNIVHTITLPEILRPSGVGQPDVIIISDN